MRIKAIARNATLYILSVMQFLFFPLAISGNGYAQSAQDSTSGTSTTQQQPESTTDSTDAATTTGESTPNNQETNSSEPSSTAVEEEPVLPPGPRGADAGTFVYDSSTGLFENDLYTYNPETQTRTAKIVPDVRYNFQSNVWEKLGWRFSAPLQDYVPYVIGTSISRPAGLAIGQVPATSVASPSSAASSQHSGNNGSGLQSNSTGPNSSINSSNDINNDFDLDYNGSTNSSITLSLLSQSGNASILNNTNGGNATSGNANSTANVINMVQSGWNLDGVLSFSADLYGDLYGDLYVDTSNLGPNSDLNVDNTINNDFDINVTDNVSIENNIEVTALTGNAMVIGNTTGGNATTGDANAAVNILNLIDTNVNSSGSFIGFLNIYGQLDGDILFPDGALESIISNTGPDSTVDSTTSVDNDIDVDITTNTNVTNNINATASTGDALVSGNTTGGNATSGQANSNVNIINLTGREVVSENTLLVFISVLGEWVGVLMDAPGLTAAAVGGNVSVNNDINNNLDLEQQSYVSIENNINVNAGTGDATVSGNTTGGNATTGNATASVNVANLTGSDIVNSNWFGVLFINVFGSWDGSFGVDTEAGDNRPSSQQVGGGIGGELPGTAPKAFVLAATTNQDDEQVYAAVPVSNQSVRRAISLQSSVVGGVATASSETTVDDNNTDSVVLASTSTDDGEGVVSSLDQTGTNAFVTYVAIGSLMLLVLFGNRLLMALSGIFSKK